MTSRLTLLLLTLLALSPCLVAPPTVPKEATVPQSTTVTPPTTVPRPRTTTEQIEEFNALMRNLRASLASPNSHYDFEHCGKPTGGRARRGYGDDYVDGLDFIVEGAKDAAVGEMPWAVAIHTRVPSLSSSSSSSLRLCTGTLVSRRHILSAAHCLATPSEIPARPGHARCRPTDHIDLDDFMAWSEVKYGGECLSKRDVSCDESMLAKSAKIKNITLFPFFADDCSRGSDLVILELDQDVVDTPHACLPHLHNINGAQLKNASAHTFHTFGWSVDKSKGIDYADRLRKSDLTLLEDRCTHKWHSLSPDVLCAAGSRHITQCLGESGAGLMTISDHRSFVVGVLSSSSACEPESREWELGQSRFTDIRLFSASIDRAIGTVGKMPDL